ncbi:Uma2 family endonuclease [Saccharopolyspora gregorii]|uniref:Uma2 family endonuclease n=1 Tax=Saccharopolyspora gregorii TaxID=33914 RepID=A0ABP6RWK6_9PSEU
MPPGRSDEREEVAIMRIETGAGRPFSVHDLDGSPEDGRRYELVDGELMVSALPGWPHQAAVVELASQLHIACTAEYRVLPAPFAVRPDPFTELRPDVLVARHDDLTLRNLPTAPVLAVEVVSASSRIKDSTLKKAVYARLGARFFWLVDPDLEEPSITAWELVGGSGYQRIARAREDEVFEVQQPFPVKLTPADLVAGLRP